MKPVLIAIAGAVLCASVSAASALEVQCAKHSMMVGLLSKKYSESPIAMGTVNQDRFMQLFVSAEGSWTILMTQTDGNACILAAGENWEALSRVANADPAA